MVGGRIGAEAVKVLLTMARGPMGPVDVKREILEIKRRVPSPEHVKKALELVQQPVEKVGPTEWTFAKETVLLDAKLAKEPVAQVEVQAIQVGPAVFVANPAEYFVQLGVGNQGQESVSGSLSPWNWPTTAWATFRRKRLSARTAAVMKPV